MSAQAGGPPGAMPNFPPGATQLGDYTQMQIQVIVIETVFTFLSLVALSLRLWARRIKRFDLVLNDYAAIVAAILNLCLAATVYKSIAIGLGRHLQDLKNPPEQLATLAKCLLALQTLWALINVLVKVSILDLYIRIFRVRSLKILAYILMALSVAYFICVFLEAMLLCHPLAFNWDKTIPGGSCGNITAAYEAVGIYNLLTDAFIIILPMPWLWALQLPKAKKLGLTAIFALGFAITAISTIRVISLAVWDFSDFSYGLGRVAIWSVLEPTLGIINCCLPILQPALAKFTRSSIWTSRAGGVSSATPKIVASGSSGSHLATIGGSGMGGPRKFRRLGDEYEYPLNDMQSTTGTEGQWAGARGYDEEEAGDESPTRWANNQSAPPPPKKNAIAVKQDWNVEYDRR